MNWTLLLLLSTTTLFADVTVNIKPKENYTQYAVPNLRKRVWELEKAVVAMQKKITLLESKAGPSIGCKITSFNKTYISAHPSKMVAIDEVIKKCAKGSNAIHCDKKDVVCEK